MSDKDEISTDSTGTVFGLQEMVHELWLDFKERRQSAVCEAPREIPAPAPAVEECAGCRFWKKDAVTNDGVCRRYPIDQPRKYRTDWCGEWKA